MPLSMDLHKLQEVAPQALANAHLKDLDVQDKYGVSVICVTGSTSRTGKIFSFAKAPTADVAIAVHREAHRLLPDEIIEVQGKDVVGFLETAEEVPRRQNAASQHGFQSVIFTDIEVSTVHNRRLRPRIQAQRRRRGRPKV
jgi:hypothetical protein